MKKLVLPLSLLFLFSVFTGCVTAPKVEPASFAGTKWNQVISFMGERNTLEFVDETTCVYTFYGEPKTYIYKITGNKIKFAGSTFTIAKKGEKVTFEFINGSSTGYLQNDALLSRGNPYWIKE